MRNKTLLIGLTLVLGIGMAIGLSGCGEKMPYADLNLEDYLEVGEYTGLTVDGYTIKVSKAEIQERVEAALTQATENKDLSKKDKLKKDDTANIDYTGKIDGKTFDGGTGEGYDLKLGSGTFIKGFEDGLIGKKIGDTVDLDLTFPKDYSNSDVAGKDVTFTVTINSATRPKVPEYNDDFVKNNTDYKTMKEYEASLKQQIYDEKEETAINEQKTSLWSDVLADTEVKDYPQEELDNYKSIFDAQVDAMAEQYGVERSEILSQYYGADDEKKFQDIIEDSAKTLIKQEMLVEYIAGKEKLTYTDEEKDQLIERITGQGYDEDSVKNYTGRNMDQYAHIELLYEKVVDFIRDNAKVKD